MPLGESPIELGNGLRTTHEVRDAIDAMLCSVEAASDVARGWWRAKARLVGLDQLHIADLRAPVGAGLHVPYRTALAVTTDALAAIAPELAEPVIAMVTGATIDATNRPDKAGNAFCLMPSPDDLPYVFVHYGGGPRDLLRLAHELGHAVHYTLSARAQPPLVYEAGIISSELAAFVIEAIVAEWAERVLTGDDLRELRSGRVDYAIDAVFRQAAITRWEARVYAMRGEDTRLTARRLGELWLAEYTRFLGDGVTLPASYQYDWMRVPHVFHERFYNYSYIFAYLCSLAVARGLPPEPAARRDVLVEFLSMGGSTPLAEQLAGLGLFVDEPDFWAGALAHLASMALDTDGHDRLVPAG